MPPRIVSVLLVLLPFAHVAAQERPVLRWIKDPADTKLLNVEVTGLSPSVLHDLRREVRATNWPASRWNQLLSVRVTQGDLFADVGLPPLQGKHLITDHTLLFYAQFPLEAGVHYVAVFDPGKLPGGAAGAAPLSVSFHLPTPKARPTAAVTHVHPSASLLPENLLKFYIHFSAPMSRGHVYDYIRLRREDGQLVDLPFLELGEELWDPTMTRLTLFIDPGRIKREVKPLEDIGPALEQGKSYTLEISREWRDASSVPLKEDFRKRFKVGPPDREPPDPARWILSQPRIGTRDPLRISFHEPMDHALARRMIYVMRHERVPIHGTVELEDQERQLIFTPGHEWSRGGNWRLVIGTTIEDLAGNNIGKPFEVDLVETAPRRLTNSTVKVPFQVR